MDYRAFKERGPKTQIALVVAPGILLLLAGLLWLGGVVIGIGALLIVLALLVWPLLVADDDPAG
jgi:phosphoglycerol transferase MdoB-like AlkP superfamily enzyme